MVHIVLDQIDYPSDFLGYTIILFFDRYNQNKYLQRLRIKLIISIPYPGVHYVVGHGIYPCIYKL